jgi:peptide/nickel transport system permease protein
MASSSVQAISSDSKPEGTVARAWRKFRRHRFAMIGLVVLSLLVLITVFAPLVTRFDPNLIDLRAREQAPSWQHWFGTDQTGRDLFTRTIYAGRISLSVGVISVTISLLIGTFLGALAGHFGGWLDALIMRAVDVVMTFPTIIILLALAAVVGPGIENTMVIIGLLNWPIVCRLVRAKFLSIREQEFITAAHGLGASNARIIVRHALPNTLDVLIVYATLGVANAILLEAGLSFLGLGVQPPTSSWGNLLNVARNVSILEQFPWQWMPAGIMIILTVLSINFIGDGLRDAFDPRDSH